MIIDQGSLFFGLGSIYLLFRGIFFLLLYISSKNKNNYRIKGIINEIQYRGFGVRQRTDYHVKFNYNNKTYDRYVNTFLKDHRQDDEVTVIINPNNIDKKNTVLVVEDCKIIVPIIFLALGSLFATVIYLIYIK